MAWRAFESKLDATFARTGMLGTSRILTGKLGDRLDRNPVTAWFNNGMINKSAIIVDIFMLIK
jgi:hypothetical protein